MMRKLIVCVCSLLALCLAACGALAAGVTLCTLTPFADMDFAAQAYMDLITAWEAETGNIVEDYSGLVDEAWIEQAVAMSTSGEADIVIIPVGSGLTYEQLVTAGELAEAAPQLGVQVLSSMAEADGSVLLTPVRLNWEALYINTDVLEAAGLPVPATFEELAAVCAALSAKGVTPIANALCEWAEIVLDCAALMGAGVENYGGDASRAGALSALSALTVVGAFGSDPWNATDADMEAAFLSGQAAMRFDGESLVSLVPQERADSVAVITITQDGEIAVPGAPSFGLAITRACWADDARREAALQLAEEMLDSAALVTPAQETLGLSVKTLTSRVTACVGLLYDLGADDFDAWAEQTVAALMSL